MWKRKKRTAFPADSDEGAPEAYRVSLKRIKEKLAMAAEISRDAQDAEPKVGDTINDACVT